MNSNFFIMSYNMNGYKDKKETFESKDSNNYENGADIEEKKKAVPFTARLMAHYRSQEAEREKPLLYDPYAKRLAGDLTGYFKDHGRYSKMDYGIVRSYYIEENLLKKWCYENKKSQIILMGAGLDTKAYRFPPLEKNKHHIFEIDLSVINNHKEKILKKENPLCPLTRISGDLSSLDWLEKLFKNGYKESIPTFWIMEGLVYYLEKEKVSYLLKRMNEISTNGSKIFTDLCIPIYAEIQVGPFSKYFKWGIEKERIKAYFRENGWNVSWNWADSYDQGRDVGQKGLFFISGEIDI